VVSRIVLSDRKVPEKPLNCEVDWAGSPNDRCASKFLSIFNTGLVRFLIELFCEKPVISEALVLALYSNAKTELEIKYMTNKHESVPVNINQPEFIVIYLDSILLKRLSFETFAMPVNIQYITLNYLPSSK
jgi:hypothetical protein